jgi:hypothetical protein
VFLTLVWAATAHAGDALAPTPLQPTPDMPDDVCGVDDKGAITLGTFKCQGDCAKTMLDICVKENKAGAAGRLDAPVASGGVSWEAAVIGGLAELIADRAKAEVIAWAEGLVKKKLCSLKFTVYKEDGTATTDQERWFQETCRLVDDKELAKEFSSAVLAAAVRADLERLPRAIAMKEAAEVAGTAPAANLKRARLVVGVEVATEIVQLLRRGKAPLEVIAGLGESTKLQGLCKLAGKDLLPECAAMFGGIVVEHFGGVLEARRPNGFDASIALRVIARVMLDPERKFVCDVGKAFGDDCTKPTFGSALPDELGPLVKLDQLIGAYQPGFLRLLRAMTDLQTKVEAVLAEGTPTVGSAITVFDASVAVIEAAWDLAAPSDVAAKAKFDEIVSTIRSLLEGLELLATGQYPEAATQLVGAAAELGIDLPAGARRYLAFVVDVATAQTTDDVRRAVENMAAPVGSWRLKQERFTIAFGALPGAIGGYEWAAHSNTADGTMTSDGTAAGLFAPVGIDFAYWIGVFVSVVDLGQLTWSRIENDDAQAEPNTGFAQVFSPGAYLHVPLGRSPFTVGGGFSYAPALRRFKDDPMDAADESNDDAAWRVGAFLAVDVTLFPVWAYSKE